MLAGGFRGSSGLRLVPRERECCRGGGWRYVPNMRPFLIRWFVTTVAVAVAVQLTGMHAEGWAPLLVMALVLGVINAVIRPVLLLLSIPFILVTLGFFILVLNALLFWLAGELVPGFFVGGFWNAFFGSIIVSLVNWAFSSITRGSDGHFQIITHQSQVASGEKIVRGRIVE